VIEIDSGLSRCGVPPVLPAVELFKAIKHLCGLRFKGIFQSVPQAGAGFQTNETGRHHDPNRPEDRYRFAVWIHFSR
jgi:hypothetical protein